MFSTFSLPIFHALETSVHILDDDVVADLGTRHLAGNAWDHAPISAGVALMVNMLTTPSYLPAFLLPLILLLPNMQPLLR